jgi:hypothetical protein
MLVSETQRDKKSGELIVVERDRRTRVPSGAPALFYSEGWTPSYGEGYSVVPLSSVVPEGHTLLIARATPLAAIRVATITLSSSSVLFTIIVCPIIFLFSFSGRWVCFTP